LPHGLFRAFLPQLDQLLGKQPREGPGIGM
jgi:hypothetical protein